MACESPPLAAGTRVAPHLRMAGQRGAGTLRLDAVTSEADEAVEPAHASDQDPARRSLRRVARAAALLRGAGEPLGALELWLGLVEGHWMLVDRFDDDGRHYLVARQTPAELRYLRALTVVEGEVILAVAGGTSNKAIAFTLGAAASTVATHLSSAMRKLGVASRTELVALLGDLVPGWGY
jgi:DNA-binding CsgD family transcriptional regulator